jgi:DUF971 family protein
LNRFLEVRIVATLYIVAERAREAQKRAVSVADRRLEGNMPNNNIWPSEIRLSEEGRELKVSFEDGAVYSLPAEYLRVRSPSAEVQGHSEAERKTVGGKRNVAIIDVAPVGNYAVRLDFDDLHNSGIYTWRYLRELGAGFEENFARYLDELAAKGLDRDRPGEK